MIDTLTTTPTPFGMTLSDEHGNDWGSIEYTLGSGYRVLMPGNVDKCFERLEAAKYYALAMAIESA